MTEQNNNVETNVQGEANVEENNTNTTTTNSEPVSLDNNTDVSNDSTTTETNGVDEQGQEQVTENSENQADNDDSGSDEAGKLENFLTKADLDGYEVMAEMMENGELSLDTIEKLQKAHGADVASLLVNQLNALHAKNEAIVQERNKEVYDFIGQEIQDITDVGAEDFWKTMQTWATGDENTEAGIPQADRENLNEGLNLGGAMAKLAAKEIISRYKNSDAFTQDASLQDGENFAGDQTDFISALEYGKRQNALLAEGHKEGSREMNNLRNLRLRSIKKGY